MSCISLCKMWDESTVSLYISPHCIYCTRDSSGENPASANRFLTDVVRDAIRQRLTAACGVGLMEFMCVLQQFPYIDNTMSLVIFSNELVCMRLLNEDKYLIIFSLAAS